MKKVVTRIAPSPTGMMHMGTVKTALVNYLFAKNMGGEFILRIEDTDQKRFVEGAENYIKDSMEWLGIKPDRSPWDTELYRQSERNEAGLYTKYVDKLLSNGDAYYAFDTTEELEKVREEDGRSFKYNGRDTRFRNSITLDKSVVDELLSNNTPHVIRFLVPENLELTTNDLIRGDVSWGSEVMDDKILIKSDGMPSYHLANVVDDFDMGVTHVFRGEEWLPSLPLHMMLYDSLGFERPNWGHLPLIMNPSGKGKMSKRSAIKNGFSIFPLTVLTEDDKGNDVQMLGYKENGYEVDAFLNFLCTLGWTPSNGKEVMTMDEMIEVFDIKNVSKSGANFDLDKLNWYNSQYVNNLNIEDLSEDITGNLSPYTEDEKVEILNLAKERSVFRTDMKTIFDIFSSGIDSYNKPSKINNKFTDTLTYVDFTKWDFSNNESIKTELYNLAISKGYKFNHILPGLREALCGGKSGPDLMTTMRILGKKTSEIRIYKAIGSIKSLHND